MKRGTEENIAKKYRTLKKKIETMVDFRAPEGVCSAKCSLVDIKC